MHSVLLHSLNELGNNLVSGILGNFAGSLSYRLRHSLFFLEYVFLDFCLTNVLAFHSKKSFDFSLFLALLSACGCLPLQRGQHGQRSLGPLGPRDPLVLLDPLGPPGAVGTRRALRRVFAGSCDRRHALADVPLPGHAHAPTRDCFRRAAGGPRRSVLRAPSLCCSASVGR